MFFLHQPCVLYFYYSPGLWMGWWTITPLQIKEKKEKKKKQNIPAASAFPWCRDQPQWAPGPEQRPVDTNTHHIKRTVSTTRSVTVYFLNFDTKHTMLDLSWWYMGRFHFQMLSKAECYCCTPSPKKSHNPLNYLAKSKNLPTFKCLRRSGCTEAAAREFVWEHQGSEGTKDPLNTGKAHRLFFLHYQWPGDKGTMITFDTGWTRAECTWVAHFDKAKQTM